MRNLGEMLRDRLWLSLIGVLVILALTLVYLFGSVLDQPLLHRSKSVRSRWPRPVGSSRDRRSPTGA